MGDLQLDALAADIGPVLAPVELKGFTRLEHQRHEDTPVGRVMRALPLSFPIPHKGGHAPIRTLISKLHQISMHLLGCPAFRARFALL
jgi:hypothetical protein